MAQYQKACFIGECPWKRSRAIFYQVTLLVPAGGATKLFTAGQLRRQKLRSWAIIGFDYALSGSLVNQKITEFLRPNVAAPSSGLTTDLTVTTYITITSNSQLISDYLILVLLLNQQILLRQWCKWNRGFNYHSPNKTSCLICLILIRSKSYLNLLEFCYQQHSRLPSLEKAFLWRIKITHLLRPDLPKFP